MSLEELGYSVEQFSKVSKISNVTDSHNARADRLNDLSWVV